MRVFGFLFGLIIFTPLVAQGSGFDKFDKNKPEHSMTCMNPDGRTVKFSKVGQNIVTKTSMGSGKFSIGESDKKNIRYIVGNGIAFKGYLVDFKNRKVVSPDGNAWTCY